LTNDIKVKAQLERLMKTGRKCSGKLLIIFGPEAVPEITTIKVARFDVP
jgi:hypothetical protein